MRVQSEKKVVVKGKVFGGDKMLICLPLISKDKISLLDEARYLIEKDLDIIEWRVDYFDTVEQVSSVVDALENLSKVIKDIPIIFTCRHSAEGGQKEITSEKRIEIIEKSLETGCVDIVDVEMFENEYFLDKIRTLVKKYNAKLILSYHDFNKTPDEDFMYNKIIEGEKLGADISKIAVMSQDYGDVLKLFNATYRARNIVKIPIVTMAMGNIGTITRIMGGLFGSDMAFAVGKESSAPGQIPIDDMIKILNILPN